MEGDSRVPKVSSFECASKPQFRELMTFLKEDGLVAEEASREDVWGEAWANRDADDNVPFEMASPLPGDLPVCIILTRK
jgi:hypothetical protein